MSPDSSPSTIFESTPWRISITASVFAVSVGLSFGIMYLPCLQDMCTWDTDPQIRWAVQISLIVFFSVLLAFVIFSWADSTFSSHTHRIKGLSSVQWAFATCAVSLIIFSWIYWGVQSNMILDSSPFYKGWMSSNWVRRPTYSATQITGCVAAVALGLLLLTATKNSSNSYFLSHQDALPFHRWISWFFVAVSIAHIAVYFYSASKSDHQSFLSHVLNVYDPHSSHSFKYPETHLSWGNSSWMAALGTYATLVMVIPTLFSLSLLRRPLYNWFYFLHWLMMAGFVLLCLHATMDFYFSLPGLCLLAFDWVLRIWTRFTPTRVVKLSLDEPNGMIRIDLEASSRKDLLSFKGGQFVRVCFPEVSLLEWHPLSLAARVDEGTVSLLVDSRNGDWKRRMVAYLKTQEKVMDSPIRVIVEGPYGSEPFKAGKYYDKLLCLAGGSGITPCLAVARQYRGKALVLWSMRGSKSVDLTSDLFNNVQVQVYCTGECEEEGKDVEGSVSLLGEGDGGVVRRGRIPFARVIEESLKGAGNAGVFICGPKGFNAVAQAHVKAFSLSNECMKVDVCEESYYY